MPVFHDNSAASSVPLAVIGLGSAGCLLLRDLPAGEDFASRRIAIDLWSS